MYSKIPKLNKKIENLLSEGWKLETIWPIAPQYFFYKDNEQITLTKSGVIRTPTQKEKQQNY